MEGLSLGRKSLSKFKGGIFGWEKKDRYVGRESGELIDRDR